MKVVFIGGLTNGKIVCDYLNSNRNVNLEYVFTYPDNYEAPRHIQFPTASNVVKTTSLKGYENLIKSSTTTSTS